MRFTLIDKIEQLLQVQDCDINIAQLNRELEEIPHHKQKIESRLDSKKKILEKLHDDLKKELVSIKNLEIDIESKTQQIHKLRTQQFDIKSNEEYRALEKEIHTIHNAIRSIEDSEIEVMEKNDELKKKIEAFEQEMKQEEKIVQEDLHLLDQRLQSINDNIGSYEEQRRALIEQTDASWFKKYKRIMDHVKDRAVVKVENGICEGCHMKLPPQIIHNARHSLNIVQCSYCMRMLYSDG
jgi:predicted  nucleic acid-binding Zn-ribbon protein